MWPGRRDFYWLVRCGRLDWFSSVRVATASCLRNSSQLAAAIALLAAVSMWVYADFILIPHQQRQSAALGIPRGNLSDLYPRWLGARELLLHGRDPYGDDITREIQRGYYGRELDKGRVNDPKDQQGFAYPVYVAFLLAPTVKLPFNWVQNGFRWFLILLTAATVPLWCKAVGWRTTRLTTLAWIALTLGSFAAVQGIKLQQLTLLVCGLLASAFAFLVSGHLILAGILLALSTIKPQLAGILVAWLTLWTVSDWGARKHIAYSFGATMLALALGGELLLPGWISEFRGAAQAYLQYTGGGKSVLDVALGHSLGVLTGVLIILAVSIFCWENRRAPTQDSDFAWCLALVLAATLVIIPTYAPYNQLLLLPALMLIVAHADGLWIRGRLNRWFMVITALCVFWSWVAAVVLCALLPFVERESVDRLWFLPLASSLWVPVSVLGLTGLCAWKRNAARRVSVISATP